MHKAVDVPLNTCLLGLWIAVFYYSVGPWKGAHDTESHVLTWMMVSSVFLIGFKIMHVMQGICQLTCAVDSGILGTVTYLDYAMKSIVFWFFLVWSIFGANWLANEGLSDDSWFSTAAIVTLCFTFALSWLPLVVIFFGMMALMLACCFLAANAHEVEPEHETEEHVIKREVREARAEKLHLVTDSIVGAVLPKQMAGGLVGLIKKSTEKNGKKGLKQEP